MRSIEVDDDVFGYLQQHSEPLIDTPNDVLRRLLLGSGTPPRPRTARRRPGALRPLIERGLISPGDQLRHEQPRRHMVHEAVVAEDGWIELPDGQTFPTPSQALGTQTGTTINGWTYVHVPSGHTLQNLRDGH